jgi:hypothetical protein
MYDPTMVYCESQTPEVPSAISRTPYPMYSARHLLKLEQSTLFLEQQQASVCTTTSLAACTASVVQFHPQYWHRQLETLPTSSRILICNHETLLKLRSAHDPPSSSLAYHFRCRIQAAFVTCVRFGPACRSQDLEHW